MAQALDLLREVIAVARAEQPETVVDETPAPVTSPTARATVAPICEIPTPGCFYRVRDEDDLLGAAGIAARALCEAAMDAARRKGWAAPRAESRAKRLASKAKAQTAYTELICRGEWNSQQRARELSDGALLWLPPLCERGLLDPTRSRRVRVDPRPWSDGTTRLEPPPTFRELHIETERDEGAVRPWPRGGESQDHIRQFPPLVSAADLEGPTATAWRGH